MAPDQVNALVIIAAVAAAGLAAGYFIVRYLKGSITISLGKMDFNLGEAVEGSFEVLTRQEVRGNKLFAALVATETRHERGYNGKSETRTQEVFRGEQM